MLLNPVTRSCITCDNFIPEQESYELTRECTVGINLSIKLKTTCNKYKINKALNK